ncbi:ADAM metallopeptidase with thrombospondin type 1 motif A isoform X2 [Rhodnius prolixus]|uniref:ADAM metallopeptidase with thrombospondin type 1 motif A isoform X2 n=1 Tax=Rhodnius prolixus TaxID=13249 RepID=UPI003D18BA37
MRATGSTCRAIAGGTGLLLLTLLALGLAIAYFTSSSRHPRTGTTLPNINSNNSKISKEESNTQREASNVEYVIPMKKRHIPLHRMDIIYPYEDDHKEDNHHSGHFRGRTAAIWDPHPQYEFTGFGKTFHLDLSQNHGDFVLPNIKVTHIWENMSMLEEPNLRAEGCFYTGTVRGDPHSAVSVNLCHGMTGHIRTSSGNYLIEPAESWQGYEKPLKHMLRRITSKLIHDNCHHHRHHEHQRINEVDEEIEDEEFLDSEENKGNSRKRRSLSEEYIIELMIVADKKMKDYHGSGLISYVLTLMSTVSLIFNDVSIGNRMSVAVVKFFVFEHQDIIMSNNNNNTKASKILTKFCEWQYKHNEKDDRSPNHHDAAMLLTRENVCDELKNGTCDTLGLAEVGTICKSPDRSCFLVKDNGLSAAFTIAHEIGHILNMPHDGDFKCSQHLKKDKGHFIMSSALDQFTNLWQWSNCSRQLLTEYLDAGFGSCLKDHPTKDLMQERDDSKVLPGEHFSSDKQCQMLYGPTFTTCPYMPVCRRLWCSKNSACKTQHMPWADGTPCDGDSKWCQRGKCEPRGRGIPKPEDGGWGPWQKHSECSRTCGGGIKQSIRHCNNPIPSNGGKYCVGIRIRYRSCNTEDCPSGTPDFREQQCASFNNNNFNIQGLAENVTWVPKYGGISPENRCKLFCRVAESSRYYPLRDKVTDGTVCGPDTFDICVNGVCKPAGCDHVLHSKKELDYCGQCDGNNSTCQRIVRHYNISKYGYSTVVKIVAGSANIDIQQIGFNSSKDDNYLALMDSEKNEHILNGKFVVSMFEKRLMYGGTVLRYSGSSEAIERIHSTRPLDKDLIVQVLSVGNLSPPNIIYEYSVQKQGYKWLVPKTWSRCSKMCNGERQKNLICVRIEDHIEVLPELCEHLEKPEILKKHCNTACILKWSVTSKSACSTPCGIGERTVLLQCELEEKSTGKITAVDNTACQELARPPTVERCRGPCDKARWNYGSWSTCSVTCGDGVETRSAKCMDHSGRTTDDSQCDENEKEVQRPCWIQHCPMWKVGDWTPCSATCGLGERRRSVKCSEENGCSLKTIPPSTQTCIMQPCSFRHENAVPDDASGHQPPSEKYGGYVWKTTATACSVTCGKGWRTKYYTCQDSITGTAVSNTYCLKSFGGGDPVKEICETGITCSNSHHGTVIGKWNTSEWEPCSAICGTGFKKRTVYCRGIDGSYLPDNYCPEVRPVNEAECESPCVRNNRWTISPWSECSEPCGGGIRIRSVTCDYSVCSDSKPETKEPCNMHSCIEGTWHYGSWSTCNVSCGKGFRQRDVLCRSVSGGELPDKACKGKQLDATIEICFGYKCGRGFGDNTSPRWRTSRWSTCSSTCTQTRAVWCESSTGTEVSRAECTGKKIPKTVKRCKKRHCIQHIMSRKTPYDWKRGLWSQCSPHGMQTRTVTCIHFKGHQEIVVNDMYCKQVKPTSHQRCPPHKERSENLHWKAGEWKPCSKQCSRKGRQERKLHCYLGDREVARGHCRKYAADSKPEKKRSCTPIVCSSCRERQLGLMERNDGDYTVYVRGINLTVYCQGMNTDNPQEFISLEKDSNYAMFYDRSFKEPEDGENCNWDECSLDKSGLTFFNKIAVNLTSLTVKRDDWTFAKRWKGSMIKYGEAGDCIRHSGRRNGCQVQGEFQINLQGTGLRIHPSTVWDNYGADIDIDRSHNGVKISGRCGGGCCGFCRPRDPLRLDLVPP